MRKMSLIAFFMLCISVIHAEEWVTDFNEAKQLAASEHKNILMLFQGSDWCSVCMRLDKEILSTDEFLKKAKEQYVLLKVDFPRRKANALPKEQQEKNNRLFEKYNQKGYFPLVVILDEKGDVLGETGYKKMSPDEYFNHLTALKQ
ncbi:thioredoxin family protein [Carboxylicivirga linearis]|uniref:Thioredoxin family protein n=1 Tax=Carboxylicivirga linearis TaxID=1628157 RepID=A0ABS5JU33_9BACT|nr:thioredoxin family protein [Carboxylicivirga linearis]MBS2098402.1 thioredoxin family protein [Carboxylicivirga linearis]